MFQQLSPLTSLIKYVPRTEFLTILIPETFSNQFGTETFAKIFLSFDILTLSPILN